MLYVNVGEERVEGQVSPRFLIEGSQTLDATKSVLFKTGVIEDSTKQLLALDLGRRAILWSEPLSDNRGYHRVIGGVEVSGSLALASGSDLIALAPALRGEVRGLAVLRLPGLALGGFFPFEVAPNGLLHIPPGNAYPSGAWAAAGERVPGNPVQKLALVLGSLAEIVLDSIALPSGSSFLGMVVNPAGERLYIETDQEILNYDLVDHQVRGRVRRPANGELLLSDDGNRLYLFDFGNFFDSPGSGLAYVFGSELNDLGQVRFRPTSGSPAAPLGLGALSADGSFMVAPPGTTRFGPTFGTTRTRLLVSLLSHGPVTAVDLNDWGTGYAYRVPLPR